MVQRFLINHIFLLFATINMAIPHGEEYAPKKKFHQKDLKIIVQANCST